MRILLLNLPGEEFCRAGSRWPHRREKSAIEYNPFPFWLGYAAAVLLEAGYEADIKDCIPLHWNMSQLMSYVKRFNPNLIIVETSTPSYFHDLEIIKKFEQPVVAVGPHTAATPLQNIQDNYDYAIVGEYELALLELVQYLDGKRKKFPESVASKEKHDVTHQGLIKDLDILPWPARHLMPMERYSDPFCLGKNVAMLTSRGCPYKCSFCMVSVFYGQRSYRTRTASAVCDEVEYLLSTYNPDEVYFDDDSFTISRRHVFDVCQEIKKRNLDVQWSCMADAKVTSDMLEIMAQAGCRALKFGVESADPEVLKRIPKHIDLDDVRSTVQKCKKLGIKTHATYMIGLPGETVKKAEKTIDFALKLHTDTLQFSIATPYPGTEFYKMAEENGWLVTKDWRFFDGGSSVVIEYPDYTREQIMKMFRKGWAMWDCHMVSRKPKTVLHHLYGVYRRRGRVATLYSIMWGCKRVLRVLRNLI